MKYIFRWWKKLSSVKFFLFLALFLVFFWIIIPLLIISNLYVKRKFNRWVKRALERSRVGFANPWDTVSAYVTRIKKKCPSFVFTMTEEEFNLFFSKASTLLSFDNCEIAFWEFHAKTPTNNWVIACHGLGQNKAESFLRNFYWCQKGFNLIVYDIRNHGENENLYHVTFGEREVNDIKIIVHYLTKKYASSQLKLILNGYSLGAITLLRYLQRFSKLDNVLLAVIEGGFDTLQHQYEYLVTNRYNLPKICGVPGLISLSKNKYKFNIHEVEFVKKMKLISSLPILFIHSYNDEITFFKYGYSLFLEKIKFESPEISFFLPLQNTTHYYTYYQHYHQISEAIIHFVSKQLTPRHA